MAIILKNAPKTEESRWLNFSEEEEERYRIVFRYDEKTKELVNVEPWNAEEKYNNYCVIVPFSSSFDGKKILGQWMTFKMLLVLHMIPSQMVIDHG